MIKEPTNRFSQGRITLLGIKGAVVFKVELNHTRRSTLTHHKRPLCARKYTSLNKSPSVMAPEERVIFACELKRHESQRTVLRTRSHFPILSPLLRLLQDPLHPFVMNPKNASLRNLLFHNPT
jgi:hypothetical protein